MPQEHSKEHTIHTQARAIANDPNKSAISRPAVPAIQRMKDDKQGKEDAFMEELTTDASLPAKFVLPAGNNADKSTYTDTQPFQFKAVDVPLTGQSPAQSVIPSFPVMQAKRIKITVPDKKTKKDIVLTVDHSVLVEAVQRNQVNRKGGVFLNIGTKGNCYVLVDDLIAAVTAAMDVMDEEDDSTADMNSLLKDLGTIKKDEKEQTTKRKREPSPSGRSEKVKRQRIKGPDKKRKRKKKVEENKQQVDDAVAIESGIKPSGGEKALKFVAWNANHFGKGNDLDEKGIRNSITDFEPGGEVKKMTALTDYGFTAAKIQEFLDVLKLYANELPHFTNTTEVSLLMYAVKSLKYILTQEREKEKKEEKEEKESEKKKRKGEKEVTCYKDKLRIIETIAGSLKKHYMLAHTRNLLKQHPTLIMGFNEVGEGVRTIEEKLAGKESKRTKNKGTQVIRGPRLQSITISVRKLNTGIKERNQKDQSTYLYQFDRKKTYGNAEMGEHYEMFNTLGREDRFLGKGQVEYYPVAFNGELYEHTGCMIASGTAVKEAGPNELWTKHPYLEGYSKFRPIVIHKFVLRDDKKEKEEKESDAMDESDSSKRKEIWYGMVHTSPDGNEFDRVEIYDEQLKESIPALRNVARSNGAQLIIGGDYYIAEEAVITTPPVLRAEGNKYETDVDNVTMTRPEIDEQKLELGKSIGWSDINIKGTETKMDIVQDTKAGTTGMTDTKTDKMVEEKTDEKVEPVPDKMTEAKTEGEAKDKPKEKPKVHFTGTQQEIRNLVHPIKKRPYNFKGTLKEDEMKDVRSLTGTNENNLGLQSADYFIIDTASSKTYQAGVIDPVTGIPFYMESDNREMSDAWFSFSDHVPVMLVVSPDEHDEAVSGAFTSNKGYFNSDPFSLNIFDLRYLQVSNVMAHILAYESSYPKQKVDALKESFEKLKQIRKLGKPVEEDLIMMNTLKANADKLLASKNDKIDISTGMFEVYQAKEAYFTTVLYQIWSDITDIKVGDEKEELRNHIQDVRMIIKEEKIHTAYSRGLEGVNEEKAAALKLLGVYLEQGTLDRIYQEYVMLGGDEDNMDEFVRVKAEAIDELLQGLTVRIGNYIDGMEEEEPMDGKKGRENIKSNYKLLTELLGDKRTTLGLRKHHDTGFPGDVYDDDRHESSKVLVDEGGIPSGGSDCFLNSVCQLLTLPVYQGLALDNEIRKFLTKVDTKQKVTGKDVWELRLSLYTLNRVKTMGRQEDAAELMGKLLDEIDQNKINDPELYWDMFKVIGADKRKIINAEEIPRDKVIDNSIVQWNNGEKTTEHAGENMLNIPIDSASGLIEWLKSPVKNTFKPDYNTPNTIEWAAMNGKWYSLLQTEDKVIFKHLPTVLTIALKRFDNNLQKIEKAFIMPDTFEVLKTGGQKRSIWKYGLQGFVYHQGHTRETGHYWTHKKEGDNWKKAEDAQVGPSDMDLFGGERSFYHDVDKAYIYTYLHIGTTELKDEKPQDNDIQMEMDDKHTGNNQDEQVDNKTINTTKTDMELQ